MNIRAQKHHKLKKVMNKPEITMLCSNTLDISWDNARSKISELTQNGRDDFRSAPLFSPLSGEQLILFCDIKESMFSPGNCCITAQKVKAQFQLSDCDTTKAMLQILEHFPVLAVSNSQTMILIDSHELAFQPNSLYDLLVKT